MVYTPPNDREKLLHIRQQVELVNYPFKVKHLVYNCCVITSLVSHSGRRTPLQWPEVIVFCVIKKISWDLAWGTASILAGK